MAKESSALLIDNSNSRTKFCLYADGEIRSEIRVINTKDIAEHKVQSLLSDWRFSAVYVCSVVPPAAEVLSRSFDCPVHFLRHDSCRLSDFSTYPGKDTLGADRIANVLGLLSYNRFPAIAIDLGTAITVDVAVRDASGVVQFIGGMIAPGLTLFSEYLSSRTALLPCVENLKQTPLNSIGTDTTRAIHAGVFSGALGMIRSMLYDVSRELQFTPFIVATGGDAEWAAEHISLIDAADSLLTFRGLACFARSES